MVQDSGFGFVNGVYLTLGDNGFVVLANRNGVLSRVRLYCLLLLFCARHRGRVIAADDRPDTGRASAS